MDKINKTFNKAYDFNKDIIYFPIRHHSPSCSYHVKKAIEQYKPEVILVEGVEEENTLVDIIGDEKNICPIATYHSYKDSKGNIGEEDETYKIYMPYMESSPELVALRTAREKGIEFRFIDMPLAYHFLEDNKITDFSKYEEENFIKNKYIKILCEKEGCGSFNELWEKLFELNYHDKSHETFVKEILTFCILSREMAAGNESNILREKYMKDRINEYSKGKRTLVITGGFHTISIVNMEETFEKPFEFEKEDVNSYPLAYSYKSLDALWGYGSGMPYPYYYDLIYTRPNEYEQIANEFFIETIGTLRKNGEGISTADGIEAMYMAEELRKFRSKNNIGIYEILEGATSAFIKGEYTLVNSTPLDIIRGKLSGDRVGYINSTLVPPIINDFRKKAQELGFEFTKLNKKEIKLDFYRNSKDRERSKFLHQCDTIGIKFATLKKSVDLLDEESRGVRNEVWTLSWSPNIDADLLHLSSDGQSMDELTENLINKRIKRSVKAYEVCDLLKTSYYCGLEKSTLNIIKSFEGVIEDEHSFTSCTRAIKTLYFLYKIESLLDINDRENIFSFIKKLYIKSEYLLSTTESVSIDEGLLFAYGLNTMYTISINDDLDLDTSNYIDVLKNLNIDNPYIRGVISGIMYKMQVSSVEEIINEMKAYGFGTEKYLVGEFLSGLFKFTREILLANREFINEIDKVIGKFDKENFLILLPKLRGVFNEYSPIEKRKIGRNLEELYGVSEGEITIVEGIDEFSLEWAIDIDKRAKLEVEKRYE